ncbi:MAG: DUF805 domain-containing protein [Proteobacteria bacterium]|nr:DUF805 domain-containing protein [Pseudomonadota bacterium]MBK9253549.1 DUF805 domain-containing protein [Pseudomonadota bacterium]
MKYVIWLVRFWYAAWMIPAGVEHFYHIYPQPGANSRFPLAAEMLTALLNSHLFDLVKAVELIVGIAILFGLFSPLALLISMPVAFCVFWWDAPLSEWNTPSTIAGARVLVSQVVLCVAFIAAFRPMLAARASLASSVQAPTTKQLVLAARVVLGAWMLLNGVNHFFFSFWPTPAGQTALSAELMTALVNSQLLDVCMLIELVAGALILLGVFVPGALCVLMAVSTSGLFWAVLDQQPQTLALGFAAFALNGLLMLAYLDSYRGALQRAPLTLGESDQRTSFNTLFVQPGGRTARAHFLAALLPLAWVVFWYANKGPAANYACWGVLCLLYPAVVLHVRRLHDMGRSGWLMLPATVLTVVAMLIWAGRISLGAQLDAALPLVALLVFLAFALWGGLARGQSEANTFGPPVAA